MTVALSGDGGDEFFGGYVRYRWLRQALLAQKAPTVARSWMASWLSKVDRRRGDRLSRWLQAADPASLYAEILRGWNACPIDRLLPHHDVHEPVDFVRQHFGAVNADPLTQAASFDAAYYIPDELQVKLDRASMRVALEVRCPLLDYQVARYGATLDGAEKYRSGLKSVLRRLLSLHLPADQVKPPETRVRCTPWELVARPAAAVCP